MLIDRIAQTRQSDSMRDGSSLRFWSEDLDGIIGTLRVRSHRASPFLQHLSSRLLPRLARLLVCLTVRGRLYFVDRHDATFTVLLRGRSGLLIRQDLRAQQLT